LRNHGIDNAYALLGGWNAWIAQKGAVVTGDKPK
jgi:rhodanese-related sulfurtransferase